MHFQSKKGRLSQFSNCFSHPQQQCFAMAITAIVYGKSHGIDFNNFNIEGVLQSGDAYYRLCQQEMRRLGNLHYQLSADDLLTPLDMVATGRHGKSFRVEVSHIADHITKQYTNGSLRAEALSALCEALNEEGEGGFTFTTQSMTVGVWRQGGEYFLFDSHSVDGHHRLVDTDLGAAYLYKTTSVDTLATLICTIYSNNFGLSYLQLVNVFGVEVEYGMFRRSPSIMTVATSRTRISPLPVDLPLLILAPPLITLSAPSDGTNQSIVVSPERKRKRFIPKKKSAATKAKEVSKKRLGESQEQRAERLNRNQIYIESVRDRETKEERAERLLKNNMYKDSVRDRETEEYRAERILNNRMYMKTVRDWETEEDRAERLLNNRMYKEAVSDKETEDERAQRLLSDKKHKTSVRTMKLIDEKIAETNPLQCNGQDNCVPHPTAALFETFQIGLDWADCSECLERFPGLQTKLGVCTRCRKYDDKKVNPFTSENNMDPKEVPFELKDLSMVEEQLIAMVHPVISVYRIRGQQYGYSGQVINFPQQVSDIAQKLPRPISELSSVLIVRRQNATGYVDFRVRRDKVKLALQYLKLHNRYYSDIQIDDVVLNDLPLDGSILDLAPQTIEQVADQQQVDDGDVVITDVPNIIIDVRARQIESLLKDDSEVVSWPKIGTEPVNEFSTVGYIAMAFPALFPEGTADLREPRQIKLTPSDYFQHLIKYKDGRFAKHPRFRFFAMNSSLRWAALQHGKICVQKNSELKNLNAAGIKEKLLKDPNLIKNILCFNSSLRGTSAYWHARCGELLDLVQQIGPPTLFFTLSAADIHWPDISRLLDPGTNYEALSRHEASKRRNSLVNDNPVIIAWYFVKRADFFIKSVLVPEFKVNSFWYRFEYQHRGSVHLHGVLWLDGAPDVRNLDLMDEVARESVGHYFDKLVKTVSPGTRPHPPVHPCQVRYSDVSDHDEDYANLINCVQMHTKHGPQCMRINKRSGVEECRFKFPFPLVEATHLTKESGHWELVTERNHPLVNRHNRYITENWRANTDVQAILSVNAVLNYIAKYASKAEPRSKTLESLIGEALKKEDDTAQTAIQKLFVRMIAERDFSAQETAQILMGWPLYHCSRGFVTINVEEKQWVKMGGPGVKESNISPCDTYPLRLEEHEGMSLFEHASKFYKKGEVWVKRRTPSIVRVFPRRRRIEREPYFRQQVLINVPWRSVELLGSQGTWEYLYNLLVKKADPTLVLPRVEEEYEDVGENGEELIVEDEWMVAARMGPNGELGPEVEMGIREIDRNYSWGDAFQQFSDPLNLPGFVTVEKCNDADYTGDEIWEDPNVTFSNEQLAVLSFLEERIQAIHSNSVVIEPHMMIIQGKAGSGKSTIIKAMCAKLNRELGPNSFRLMAPTGAAAVNVGGSTIHSGLHLGIEKEFRKMGDENLTRFQETMEGCYFIIIDEMSMIGCTLLKKIDLRCREAKPLCSHLPFGGMVLFLLGDIKQLPPVLDRPVYGTGFSGMLADQGQLLFKSITSCVILSASYRQGGADQTVFRDILDRLSVGKSTKGDWEMLMSREKSRLSGKELGLFSECMRLYPENKSVNSYNFDRLKGLNRPTAKVPAEHNNKEAAQACADQQAQGLEKTLYLCVGCRVMLKTNLWVKKGLVNGSLGTVTHLVYPPNYAPPADRPLVVMVKFDNYTGPTVMGSVPVADITRTWRSKEVTCSRTQFPLILAWAVTIHKSQGLTLSRVVVDIGSRELAAGCSYVALSRSRRLADMVLEPFNLDRLIRIGTMKLLLLRIEEEARLNRLARHVGTHTNSSSP